jgi:hypothetical protein
MDAFRWVRVKKPLVHSWLLAAMSTSLAAQGPDSQYDALKNALALSDVQIAQCRQNSATPTAYHAWDRPLLPAAHVLNDAQRAKLAEIAKVLGRFQTSAGAVVMGLIPASDWPTGWPCVSPDSRIAVYAKEYDLTDDQVNRLEQLQHDVRQQAVDGLMEIGRRAWKLWASGAQTPSDTAALLEETARLVKQRDEAGPPRDLALAVLNDAQMAKLAAFRHDLELAREALELHLIQLPPLPEIFCH